MKEKRSKLCVFCFPVMGYIFSSTFCLERDLILNWKGVGHGMIFECPYPCPLPPPGATPSPETSCKHIYARTSLFHYPKRSLATPLWPEHFLVYLFALLYQRSKSSFFRLAPFYLLPLLTLVLLSPVLFFLAIVIIGLPSCVVNNCFKGHLLQRYCLDFYQICRNDPYNLSNGSGPMHI